MLFSRGLLLLITLIIVKSKRGVEKGCWPFNVIPYRIEKGFSKEQEQMIRYQIGELHRLTCVRWVDINEQNLNVTDYALFVKTMERTCYTEDVLGQTLDAGYVSHITLSDVCFQLKTPVIHEMLHVMGFDHEHQRSDRDCYIDVHARKVNASGKALQYKIIPQEEWLERFPYDKRSVMHYRRDNRMRARTERWYQNEPLGNMAGVLTYFDRWKIMYRFCNALHFCDDAPFICELVEIAEKNCRKSGRH